MVPLDDGYGEFLKDRYGVENLTLRGSTFSGSVVFSPKVGIGFERDTLQGEFKYKTLNGESQTNELILTQQIILLHLYPFSFKSLEFSIGTGSNKLTRTFYGYKNSEILATNVADNEGAATKNTGSSLTVLQVFYRLFGESIGLDIGARYTNSKHSINVTDKRPGYDDKGNPEGMNFQVGGYACLLALTITF